MGRTNQVSERLRLVVKVDVPDGWKLAGGNDWFTRVVSMGPLIVKIDVWHIEGKEWAVSFNSGKVERIYQGKACGALRAAEVILAAYLRAGARLLAGKRRAKV